MLLAYSPDKRHYAYDGPKISCTETYARCYIEDSGIIPIDEKTTTFVGINESGKTNIMRALRKLNNKNDTQFKKLTENPIWHFREWDPEEIFVTGKFILDENERSQISKIDSDYSDLTEISFSRNKKMDLICQFNKKEQTALSFTLFYDKYLSPIQALIQSIDFTSINDGENQKKNIESIFASISTDLKDEPDVKKQEILQKIKQRIKAFKQNLDSISASQDISKIIESLKKIDEDITEDGSKAIKEFLVERLPRFIYFENIGVINSRIDLKHLVEHISSNDLTEAEVTTKTLLDMAGLDPNELLTLDDENGKAEQSISDDKDTASQLCNQASLSLTREMDAIWSQNEHTLEIELNGTRLRIWVINKQDSARLQLEERSRGYQWYFSFYIVFNVESERRYKDSILLLDEPALFLHATGQEDFLKKVLPQLSEKNQIIYTTHSPFLLDMHRPFSIHTVTLDKNASRRESHISKEHWASDREALFPLQSAVGYHLAQSMFIGTRNMIVEGLTDFWILEAVSSLLEANGKISLNKKNFVLTPAGGATKTILLAKTYVSQNLNVGVLLDSDRAGNTARKQITNEQILKSNRILLLNDIFDKSDQTMSLEDIFPENYYLDFVKQAYKEELQGTVIELKSTNPMVTKRVESFFQENNLGNFDKTKLSLLIMKEFPKCDFSKIPPELIENFEKLFTAINEIMK